jgi:hypothetical protein
MKKAILNGMTVLFAILLFSSCDALMEDALQDRDTTALETERDTYVTPDESTEEPTDPSTEIPTDELTEVSTEAPTEGITYADETVNQLVNQLRAEGFNMEQLTFHEEHTNYTYTATVSDRVFYPGEQIEIILTDLISYNDEVDLELFLELGQLQVMLNNYKGTFVIYEHAVTENGETFTLTVPSDMQSGVYSIELFLADWMLTVCPVVVCSAEEPTDSIPDETLPSLLDSFTLEENPKMFMLIVELEGADGCDMEQLTYRMAHKDGKTYSYTATLNHRVYQPGDTIEISFRDLVYQGKAVDIQEAIKSGLLKVSLSDYCMVGSPEENAFTWTEDGRAVLTVTRDMAPDTDDIPGYVYSVTVYVGEEAWFFSGIIIY